MWSTSVLEMNEAEPCDELCGVTELPLSLPLKPPSHFAMLKDLLTYMLRDKFYTQKY